MYEFTGKYVKTNQQITDKIIKKEVQYGIKNYVFCTWNHS
jgi:hypothetical protein